MGEYAIRKSDNAEIKIGTCEEMFYLRWEDRDKVKPLPGNVNPASDNGLFFRLPFPDEDLIQPGDYKDHARGLRLGSMVGRANGQSWWKDWEGVPEMADSVGILQIHHNPSGLLVNVPCHHGMKLPNLGDAKAFWNGKGHSIELRSVKIHTDGRVYPVVCCRQCGESWRMDWPEIWDYIPKGMRSRLAIHHAVTVS